MTSRPYPLYVQRTIKVDSILYQKFALCTYSPFRHEIIIIIIIIRKGRQCKAGRERLTPYQSEDPNPTTSTNRMKEEKGKTV